MAFKDALLSVVYSGIYTRGESDRKMVYGWEDQKERVDTQITLYHSHIFQGGAVIGGIKGAKAIKQ